MAVSLCFLGRLLFVSSRLGFRFGLWRFALRQLFFLCLCGDVVDFIASSPEDLLAKLDGRTITRFDGSSVTLALAHPAFVDVGMTARQKFLAFIIRPDIFFILLVGAALGIYTEFTHPGLFAPGVFGGLDNPRGGTPSLMVGGIAPGRYPSNSLAASFFRKRRRWILGTPRQPAHSNARDRLSCLRW